jgi:release factor glutamine methyltransferase
MLCKPIIKPRHSSKLAMLKLKTQLKAELEGILKDSRGPSAQSFEAEARIILFHFFKGHPNEHEITPEIEQAALMLAKRRAEGFPLQYLLGYQYFYAHEYEVSTATLIPRPETEILVDSAIRWAREQQLKEPIQFAELGLGSGAISIELLAHLPGSQSFATEISSAAREVALRNLDRIMGPNAHSRLKITQPVEAQRSYEPFFPHGPFDLFISNPPYLLTSDEISSDVRNHEPSIALFPSALSSELDANYYYQEFARHARHLLKPNGAAFFEIPHERADTIQSLWSAAGLQTEVIFDLTGRPRVLKGSF